jgi:hypothetical protein
MLKPVHRRPDGRSSPRKEQPMTEYRVTFRRDDGREAQVTVMASDRAEAIGRASAQAEPRTGRAHGRVIVEQGATPPLAA